MIVRRLPMLVISVVALVAVVVTSRTTVLPVQAVFSNVSAPWMPAAPLPGGLNSTWFCPGVPAGGVSGTGGEVTVFNTEDTPMRGRLTVLRVEGEPVTQAIDVPAFGSQPFDIDELIDSPYAAAFVEIDGGGGLVEQKAIDPAGESVSACANSSADQWYLATGDTLDDSVELLVLSNPHDNDAIVDIALSTSRGSREPTELQNYPVPARSVRIVDVGTDVIANEEEVGVTVLATRGNVVVGRAQTYGTERRTGYVMSLAAPALSDQWWFAYGLKDPDVTVTYSLYNPNDFDVEVTPVMLGFAPEDEFTTLENVVVPSGEVGVVTLSDVAGVPDGLVSVVFGTESADQRIVAERIVTRTIQGVKTTSVTVGAPPRLADGYVANTWYVGIGPSEPTEDGLTIFNVDGTEAVVTVQVITAEGIQTVESLAEVDLPSAMTISIDLTDPAVIDRPLIIRSTSRVFVERVLRREPAAQGRVSTWAVPASE